MGSITRAPPGDSLHLETVRTAPRGATEVASRDQCGQQRNPIPRSDRLGDSRATRQGGVYWRSAGIMPTRGAAAVAAETRRIWLVPLRAQARPRWMYARNFARERVPNDILNAPAGPPKARGRQPGSGRTGGMIPAASPRSKRQSGGCDSSLRQHQRPSYSSPET
jgi:hypothetical protein